MLYPPTLYVKLVVFILGTMEVPITPIASIMSLRRPAMGLLKAKTVIDKVPITRRSPIGLSRERLQRQTKPIMIGK